MLRGFIVWVGNREQDTADRLLSALWVAAADSSSLLLWMMWISQLCLVIHSWSVICCCPVRVSQLSMMYFSCIGFVRVWVPLKLSALVTVAGVSYSLHVNDERCHLDVTRWFVGCCLEPLNVEAHTFFFLNQAVSILISALKMNILTWKSVTDWLTFLAGLKWPFELQFLALLCWLHFSASKVNSKNVSIWKKSKKRHYSSTTHYTSDVAFWWRCSVSFANM